MEADQPQLVPAPPVVVQPALFLHQRLFLRLLQSCLQLLRMQTIRGLPKPWQGLSSSLLGVTPFRWDSLPLLYPVNFLCTLTIVRTEQQSNVYFVVHTSLIL